MEMTRADYVIVIGTKKDISENDSNTGSASRRRERVSERAARILSKNSTKPSAKPDKPPVPTAT
jgi:hypothetical protein